MIGIRVVGAIEDISVNVLIEEEKGTDILAVIKSKKAPIIALVSMIILRAMKEKASLTMRTSSLWMSSYPVSMGWKRPEG